MTSVYNSKSTSNKRKINGASKFKNFFASKDTSENAKTSHRLPVFVSICKEPYSYLHKKQKADLKINNSF